MVRFTQKCMLILTCVLSLALSSLSAVGFTPAFSWTTRVSRQRVWPINKRKFRYAKASAVFLPLASFLLLFFFLFIQLFCLAKGMDRSVRVWNVAARQIVADLARHARSVQGRLTRPCCCQIGVFSSFLSFFLSLHLFLRFLLSLLCYAPVFFFFILAFSLLQLCCCHVDARRLHRVD